MLEKGDCLAALDSRKALKEIIQRVAGAQVIDEVSDRNTCAREDRLTAHDFGVNSYKLCFHH